MDPKIQGEVLGFIEAMGGLSKVGASLPLAQRISRMMARQFYGLTGSVPREAGMSAAERLRELRRLGVGEPGAISELMAAQRTGKGVPMAEARLEAARHGMEHLPGFLKNLLKKPGKTMALGWKSHTPAGKFIIGSAPIIPVYGAVTGKDLRPGETLPGRIAEEAGRTAGFSASGMLPAVPGIGVGFAAGKAGKGLVESLL